MRPAEVEVQIYRSSTNGFVIEYEDTNGDPVDLSVFHKFEFALMLGSRHSVREIFTPNQSSNKLSITFTPEKTDEHFKSSNYKFEVRFYTDEDDYTVYTIVSPKFIDAFNTGSTIDACTVVVDENSTSLVEISDSSIYAAMAFDAKNQSEQLKSDTQAIADQALTDITNSRDAALSQIDTDETDALDAIQTAHTNGVQAITDARDQGVDAVESARSTALQDIQDARQAASVEIQGFVTQAEEAKDYLENHLLHFISEADDGQSVRLAVGTQVVAEESTTGYDAVTLNLSTA